MRNNSSKWGAGLYDPSGHWVVRSVADGMAFVDRRGQERKRAMLLISLQVVPLHPSKQVQPVQSADMVGKRVVSMYGTESCKRVPITDVGAGSKNPFHVSFKSPLRGTKQNSL